MFNDGKLVQLVGLIDLDLCFVDNFIPSLMDITIQFHRAPHDFVVKNHTNDIDNAQLLIESMKLFVKKPTLDPLIEKTLLNTLSEDCLTIAFERWELRQFSMPREIQKHTFGNLFGGTIPRKVIVGFVESGAAVGDAKKNPFNFQHKNLRSIFFTKNGQRFPTQPLETDFENKKTALAYYRTLRVLNYANEDCNRILTHKEFQNGSTIMAFDLSVDNLDSEETGFRASDTGNLTLDVEFAATLDEAMVVMVLGEFCGKIEISKHRGVVCDF